MPKRPRLVRGKDYEIEDGDFVFTREYLLSLGTCCDNNCRHCPYREPSESRGDAPVATTCAISSQAAATPNA